MAKFYSELDDKLCEFIHAQHIFFTATAPTEGRINLSPKGIDSFRCLNFQQVAYLDLTGSGNETAAHIHQNGRMTIMFCSFSSEPLILRLYGNGEVVLPDTARWQEIWNSIDILPMLALSHRKRFDLLSSGDSYSRFTENYLQSLITH
jgi:Pyridoxamine 5'-phosphate oxidase